jgi:hypothetical protein
MLIFWPQSFASKENPVNKPVTHLHDIEGWKASLQERGRVNALLTKFGVSVDANENIRLGDLDHESAYVDLSTPNDYRIDGVFSLRSLCVILGVALLQSPNHDDLPKEWEDLLVKLSQSYSPQIAV